MPSRGSACVPSAVLINGGPGTGIHKSEDGGETWRELTEGLPEGMMAKTGHRD